MSGSAPGMPLSALLSWLLVAYTIEFDNEAERRTPHWTTRHGKSAGAGGPWLTSMVMYLNCMRFVGDEGITVNKVEELARTETNWAGMERWGYVTVEPDPKDSRPKPPRVDWLVRATRKGRIAQEAWRPLFGVMEERWRERFGEDFVDRLRKSLWAVTRQFSVELPDCLPILGYALFSKAPKSERRVVTEDDDGGASLPRPALLARVLLAFAIQFERRSELSLAISANVLRVMNENGVRARDLPILTGVSKESISMAMGILAKKRLATLGPDRDSDKGKIARLTAMGVAAQAATIDLILDVERSWIARFGADAIAQLRAPLEQLAGNGTADGSPLFQGLEPDPDGWRAAVRKPKTLPHFPMVLHRGGYPDGS